MRIKYIITILLMCLVPYTYANKQQDFINKMEPIITKVLSGSNIYPKLALAQTILETGWGGYVKGNNYFNIKGKGQIFTTHEVINGNRIKIQDSFKSYNNIEESVISYRLFLESNNRYNKVFKATTPIEQAKALQQAGYATDPNYAKKLINIMENL